MVAYARIGREVSDISTYMAQAPLLTSEAGAAFGNLYD
jgi:hypothetical protein